MRNRNTLQFVEKFSTIIYTNCLVQCLAIVNNQPQAVIIFIIVNIPDLCGKASFLGSEMLPLGLELCCKAKSTWLRPSSQQDPFPRRTMWH
jgi:hypothetical protein